eukprot:4085636-Ditylum_brightwellii.AAC.1
MHRIIPMFSCVKKTVSDVERSLMERNTYGFGKERSDLVKVSETLKCMEDHATNVLHVIATNASKLAYAQYSCMEKRKYNREEWTEMEVNRSTHPCNGVRGTAGALHQKEGM